MNSFPFVLPRFPAPNQPGLIADTRVYNSTGEPFTGDARVNGNGELFMEFAGVTPW